MMERLGRFYRTWLDKAILKPMRLVVAAVVLLDRSGRWATGLQVLVVTGYTLVIGYTTPAA